MLPQNKPDRIRILFDDHRLVANAGLLLPATLARHLGLRELVDHHLGPRWRAGTGEHWGQDADAGRFRAGRRRLHRRRRCAARWWDGRCSRLRGQGAIHPGDLPAQLPVGACPSTRPRDADSPPDMVGSCLVCFQGVSGCRPGVTHDMIGHRTGSRAPSLRVSAAVRCQLWLFSVRRRHGPAWQLGRVAYKPMLQAGSLCSIRLGSQRQYPLPRPEQQLV